MEWISLAYILVISDEEANVTMETTQELDTTQDDTPAKKQKKKKKKKSKEDDEWSMNFFLRKFQGDTGQSHYQIWKLKHRNILIKLQVCIFIRASNMTFISSVPHYHALLPTVLAGQNCFVLWLFSFCLMR